MQEVNVREKYNESLTLQDITGQDSGIVIDGDKVIVVNWATYLPDGGLPIIQPSEYQIVAKNPAFDKLVVEEEPMYIDDIRTILPGEFIIEETDGAVDIDCTMDILYDISGEIPMLWGYDTGQGAYCSKDPVAGSVYKINGVTVIAPNGWR